MDDPFPGEFTGASLKPGLTLTVHVRLLAVPGEFTGASLKPTGTRVHAGRYVRGRLGSGEPDRKAAIRSEQLRCFDERRRGIGLAGLSYRQHSDGHDPKRRLEIATRPVRFHSPRIMKQIISRGEMKCTTVALDRNLRIRPSGV